MASAAQKLKDLRDACESSLYTFACTVEPHRLYGDVHKELFNWWQNHNDGNLDDDSLDNLLALLPRDHQKSHCMAVLAAWFITRDPSVTIIYTSATAYLSEQQLLDIKNILESKTYQLLWPDMIHKDVGKRHTWNNNEIVVDHPARKAAGVRDATVLAVGLTTNTTGLHCKILMKDDVVVPDNAYTAEGRRKVNAACSQLASVLTTGGKEFAVGTRYHPADHYNDLKEMTQEIYSDKGEVIGEKPVYDIYERVVEENGVFLWPKEFMPDGKGHHGFDWKELAIKKAKYLDKTQFFAQYYNNPNDMENQRIDRTRFQYYDQRRLVQKGGNWFYKADGHGDSLLRLNVYAGVDFAFSQSAKADSTCIVVIGVDAEFNIYVLDIERFKTNKMDTYFQNIVAMHNKWEFKMLRAEVSVAQETIVQYIKDEMRKNGMALKIDSHRPNKYMGAKEERISAALEPRYQNMQMFHYKGGYCGMLEEELMLENPPHDDIKDTLAIIVSGNIHKPSSSLGRSDNVTAIKFHPRFGGMM